MKIRLSETPRLYQLFLVVIALYLIGHLITERSGITNANIINASVLILVTVAFAWLIEQIKTVDFDDDNVYIKQKGNVRSIPLKSVTEIKWTKSKIVMNELYRFHYLDDVDSIRTVYILPSVFSNALTKFEDAVKSKNSNVKLTRSLKLS